MRIIASLLCVMMLVGCTPKSQIASHGVHDSKCSIVDGRIVFDTPQREAGQQTMLEFAAEPIAVVRVGIIGIGMRGQGAVNRMSQIENVEIKAICDLYPDNFERVQQYLDKAEMPRAEVYEGVDSWKQLCDRDDLDLVYIVTDWLSHTPMALYAMEHGKHVAIEVPAAQSVKECWQLVDASERTRKHCMMLENCVYDHFELTTLSMAQEGLFGEIIHAEGAYIHCLDPFWAAYKDNWRLDFNEKHAGDVYATHGIGPICQALNIHRGDKMNTLVSVSTKSFKGVKLTGNPDFKNGDQTSTLITTERGKTMLIQHNVMTPRLYDRLYKLVGTEGYANKYPVSGYLFENGSRLDSTVVDIELLNAHRFVPKEVEEKLMETYMHPTQQQIMERAKQVGGHGGMDFMMDYRLIYCLQNGLPLDQDVYDAAEWSCIGELSAKSFENGAMPVEVPDFTRGDWNKVKGYKSYYKQ